MLKFFLKITPAAVPLDLDPFLVKGGYSRSIEIAAEDRINSFRGSQLQVTLDNRNRRFSHLQGGEEISIQTEQGKILWAGTVDPASIEFDIDSQNLVLRVLQHGSLLNTVYAGLPDWSIDNGNLVINSDRRFRLKGRADQWVRINNPDGTFARNELADEEASVYYTPAAADQITDPLYKSKFAERVHYFHTAGTNIGDVEYPYPQIYQGGEGPHVVWTGPFQPHYHPNFDKPANDWPTQSDGIQQDPGSFLKTRDPVFPFKRHPIPELIAELVRQFNQSARFPLDFDPSADCVLISPQIQQEIEILKRQPDVDFIDLRRARGTTPASDRTYVCVNWKSADSIKRFSLYHVNNETELVLIADRVELPDVGNPCWPTYSDGIRFTHNFPVSAINTALYRLSWSLLDYPGPGNNKILQFHVQSYFVANATLVPRGPLYFRIDEVIDNFDPHEYQSLPVNRSVLFVSTTTGEAYVRDNTGVGNPLPPELEPQSLLVTQGRTYRARSGGLSVSGALFDRAAIDAEQVKLSSLLSDLAKLTHSVWFVTPDRRLKFLSRQFFGTNHKLKPARTLNPLQSFSRRVHEQDIPSIGRAVVLPDNVRQAYKNWFEDNVLGISAEGYTATLPLEDFASPPVISDSIELPDPGLPAIPDPDKQQKFAGRFRLEKAVLDIDNETLELTAVLPTL